MLVFKMVRDNLITKFQSCLIMKKVFFFEKLNNKSLFPPLVKVAFMNSREVLGVLIFFSVEIIWKLLNFNVF